MNTLTLAHALNGSGRTEFSGYDFSGQEVKRGSFKGRTFTDCSFRDVVLGSHVDVRGGRVRLYIGGNIILQELSQVSTQKAGNFSSFMRSRYGKDFANLPLCGLTIQRNHITALAWSISFIKEDGLRVVEFSSLPALFQQDEFLLSLGVQFVR